MEHLNIGPPLDSPSPIAEADAVESTRGTLPRASGRFVSHVLALITGNGIAQAVQVGGTLILARLCAPDDFGIFALFVSAVSFVAVLGGARYELSIMLPESDVEAANLLFLSTFVLIGLSAVSVPGVMLLHGPLQRLFGDATSSIHLWWISLAFFINAFWQVLGFWHGRMKRFRTVAISRVLQTGGTIAIQLALLLSQVRPSAALIDGWIVGQSLGPLYLLAQALRWDGHFLAASFDLSVVREGAARYRNFPFYKAPYSFVVNGASQLVVMILRMFSSLDIVGLYSLANRAIYAPTSLISTSMNQVFYEKAAGELKSGKLEHFVNRLLRIQAVLGMPILVFFAFDMKLLFRIFFGSAWTNAGSYGSLLAFAGYFYFVSSWLDRIFDVQGRQRLSLILQLIGNGASLGGMFLVLYLTHNSLLGVGTFAAVELLYGIVWLWFVFRVAGFDASGLVRLGRDVLFLAAGSFLVIGFVHVVLSAWTAFIISSCAVGLMELATFLWYASPSSGSPRQNDPLSAALSAPFYCYRGWQKILSVLTLR